MTLEELLALIPENNRRLIGADDLRTIVTDLFGRDVVLGAGLDQALATANAAVPNTPEGRQELAESDELGNTIVEPMHLYALADPGIKELLRATINQSHRYNLVTWIPTRYGAGTGDIVPGGTEEPQIRPPASVAFSLAVAIRTGNHDEAATGVTTAAATAQAVRIIRSLAALHRANGGNWGGNAFQNPFQNSWQESLWAFYICTAGWLIWNELTTTTQGHLQAIVRREADRMINWATWPVWKDRDGVDVHPGDSKSEEIAWNSSILILAMAMFPTDARVPAWKLALARMSVAAFATPSDMSNNTPVNGIVPSSLPGYNIPDDGVIINHDIIHPDYIISAQSSQFIGFAIAAIAGVTLPVAMGRHADLLFSALTTVPFTSPPYLAPGGTIYKPLPSRDFYYPQGSDWGTQRTADKAAFDVMAHRYGWDTDPESPARAWQYATLHLQRQEALQERTTTGATYLNTGEDSYAGAEQWVSANLASALLAMSSPRPKTTTADLTVADSVPGTWAATIAARTPALWWKLDETSGTTIADSSGNGRAGTLANFGAAPVMGAASLIPSDAAGKSLTLNGGTRVRITDVSALQTAGTLYFTMKKAAPPASNETLVARSASTGTQRSWAVRVAPTGKLVGLAWNGGSGVLAEVATPASVCDNANHLIALIVTAYGWIMFVDGKPVCQSLGPINLAATDSFSVGSFADSGQPASAGFAQVVWIPTVLDTTQIASDYRAWTGV